MTHTTELYFEAHITIDPVVDEDRDVLEGVAKFYGFRVAELLYKKSRKAARLDDFMTGRHKSYDQILKCTEALVQSLQYLGCNVRRYKIENTLVDVRLNAHN